MDNELFKMEFGIERYALNALDLHDEFIGYNILHNALYCDCKV